MVIDGRVLVRDGVIQLMQPVEEKVPPGWSSCPVIDLGPLALLPGFVDAHVHLNDPRPGEPWEGFASGTQAAAAAGITAVLDMPLNSLPVTTSRGALDQKLAAAAGGSLAVDIGLFGGLVPGALNALPELIQAGVWGIKCFLCESGLDTFPAVDHETLSEAMSCLARQDDPPPLLAHAERVHGIPGHPSQDRSPSQYTSWLASRPGIFEQRAVSELIQLVEETGCPLHIVHVSSNETLALIRDAKQAGLPVTAETCPHYLMFTADDVPDGGTPFKCAPPIRGPVHREALWQALADGTLDLVASDHSPCPPAMKALDTGDFFSAWGGIASLELGPAVTWALARQRGHTLRDLANWWSHAPAKRFGLPNGIKPGLPATFIAFDPDAEWHVDAAILHHRHKITPYDGLKLAGKAEIVWLRGRVVLDRGKQLHNNTGRVMVRRSLPKGPRQDDR